MALRDFVLRLPEDFLLGTANSAFQSEGAYDRDGKTLSTMDHYARAYAGKQLPSVYKGKPGKLMTEDFPDDGCFFYDNYEAYIADMKKTGQNTYRMSLAWPRLIPDGTGEVNQTAVTHYRKVLQTLLDAGITPFVDLLHWDLPMCLHERGGYENPDFPRWFAHYAQVCFDAFGDQVKLWSTVNEPCIAISCGYYDGRFPPFISDLRRSLLAAHHMLLAHYAAVRAYRATGQGGKIGAVNAIMPVYSETTSQADIDAARRQNDIHFNWWAQPMVYGSYPEQLLAEASAYREAMPEHYAQELKDSFAPMDFMGINYYITARSAYDPEEASLSRRTRTHYVQEDVKVQVYPAGLLDSLLYVRDQYSSMEIYVTENGLSMDQEPDEEAACNDEPRVGYIREHLRMVARAIMAGVNVKGYYYWNDADSYEQLTGYKKLYGLTWVDRETGRRRWKKSREYFQTVAQTHVIV